MDEINYLNYHFFQNTATSISITYAVHLSNYLLQYWFVISEPSLKSTKFLFITTVIGSWLVSPTVTNQQNVLLEKSEIQVCHTLQGW